MQRAVLISSRGDKTAIELFLAGLGGWDAGLRRCFGSDQYRTVDGNRVVGASYWSRSRVR